MKKLLVIVSLFICFGTLNAQPPHIVQFRKTLENAKGNFKDEVGELISKDKQTNIYKPKVPTDMGEAMVMESLAENGEVTDRNYIILFKKQMSEDEAIQSINNSRFSIMGFVAKGYLAEMAEQVKAGSYTVKENYEREGKLITDWYTKENTLAVRYAVDDKSKTIIMYRTNK